MKRRDFITLAGGVAVWPLTARAQQAMPVIGYLGHTTLEQFRAFAYTPPLFAGLSEMGYIEGQHFRFEYLGASNRLDRLPALAADLVRNGVAVIIAPSTPAALAAKAATDLIPIVFQTANDPVSSGLVSSLNRPGGNLTGISNLLIDAAGKRLEILHETVPAARSMGLLTNLTSPGFSEAEAGVLQTAARALGVALIVVSGKDSSEFEEGFATLVRKGVGAVLVSGETLFFRHSDLLVSLAARFEMPTIYPSREHTKAGGLMSYGTAFSEVWRQVGIYAGRLLKGEKASDLPVQLVTRMELVINMKTAKELGINIPLSLLGRADQIIE